MVKIWICNGCLKEYDYEFIICENCDSPYYTIEERQEHEI